MDEEKDRSSMEDLQDTVDEYGEHAGEDLLTDPRADAAAADSAESDPAAEVGKRIRAARDERGFTLEELSAKTGIDADALAKVESEEATLPLGKLIKLSKALSMTMTEVISPGKKPFTIVRASERQRFARFGESREARHGYVYEALASEKQGRKMEPFIVKLLPASSDEPSSHDGQEFIYVLDGEMEVLIEETREVLEPGDCIYYDSSSMHLVRAHGDKPATILAVLTS